MRCNVLIPRLKTAHGIHWDSLGRIGQIAGSLPEIPFLGSVTIRSERVACPCPTKWWSVHNHKISFFRGRPKMLKPKTISNASKKNTVSILIFLSHSFVGVWELNAGIADGQSGIPGLLLVCAKEGRGFLGEASSMVGFAADASWNHYLWGQNPSKFPRSWGAANCEDGCRMLQEFLDPSWKPIPRTRQMQADDVPSIGCWLVNACLYRCTFSTPTKRHLHSLLTIFGLELASKFGKTSLVRFKVACWRGRLGLSFSSLEHKKWHVCLDVQKVLLTLWHRMTSWYSISTGVLIFILVIQILSNSVNIAHPLEAVSLKMKPKSNMIHFQSQRGQSIWKYASWNLPWIPKSKCHPKL